MPISRFLKLSMMAESGPEVIWDKEIDVPEKWIQFVDDNVAASTCIRCHLRSCQC